MTTTSFCGPLASDFAAFAATLEASATANKTTLTQLRALDRFTAQRGLPSGTIDVTLARVWLADCALRAPNTRRAATTCCAASAVSSRPAVTARSCRASRFVRAADRRSHPTSTPAKRCLPYWLARSRCGTGPTGIPARSGRQPCTRSSCCWSRPVCGSLKRCTSPLRTWTWSTVCSRSTSRSSVSPGSCRSPRGRWRYCAAITTCASWWPQLIPLGPSSSPVAAPVTPPQPCRRCSMTSPLKQGCGRPTAVVRGYTICGRPSPSLGCCSGIATARTSWPGCRC